MNMSASIGSETAEHPAEGLFTLDHTDHFTYVSPEAAAFLDRPVQEVVGRPLREVLPPSEYGAFLRGLESSRETDAPVRLEQEVPDSQLRLFFTLYPSDDQVSVHFVDVTDRRLREKELQLLSSAVEHAGEGVIITDASGTIEYVNPAFEEITGYSREEAIGENPRILNSGEQDEAFYRQMWDTLLSGRAWRARFINRRKDGTLYTHDPVITPVHSEDGEITHLVAVFRDVTDELALEEQLRQSQKLEAVGRLAGGIAHDFNNVLTIITGRAQFALDDLPEDAPLASEIQEVLGAADLAQRLSRQMLTFSRQEVIRPEVLDLGQLVRDTKDILHRLLGEDLNLQVSTSPDLGRIKVDRTQIEQVLYNLASNARDAMPGGGTLTIEADNVALDDEAPSSIGPVRAGEYVLLRVSDTGTGMDEATREHAFDPFYTTKPRGFGTGLGLSTVHGIVQKVGGTIRLESEPDRGTTFEIYLPKTDEAPEAAGRADTGDAPTGPEKAPGGSETILVVEDQSGVRSMVRQSLERVGYCVLDATHGREALKLCATESGIDLVVTDMVMPEMGGRELAEEIRANYPDIPILYMSGYTDLEGGQSATLDDRTHLIEKPFGPGPLQRKVRQVLDS